MNRKKLWAFQNIGIVLPLLYRAANKRKAVQNNGKKELIYLLTIKLYQL